MRNRRAVRLSVYLGAEWWTILDLKQRPPACEAVKGHIGMPPSGHHRSWVIRSKRMNIGLGGFRALRVQLPAAAALPVPWEIRVWRTR